MWRRSLIVFAVLCGASAGVVIALKSRRVADNLKAYAARVANEQYGVTLHIDELEIELLPPGVAVRGVEVYRPDQDEAWIELHHGRIVVRPWPSAAGALVIHHLELDGLRADFDLRGAGDLFGDADASGGSHIAIDVRELLLWNTDLSVETDDGRIAIHRTDLRMSPAASGGRELELSLGYAVISRDGRHTSLEAKARGLFRGSIDRPESIQLDHATLNLREIAVSAKGTLNLIGSPTVDILLDGKAPLARLREFVDDMPAIDGDFHGSVHVQGPILAPRSRIRAELTNIRYGDLQLGDLDIDAVHSGTRVNVESFRFAHGSAGVVTGSGSVEIASDVPITVTARLHRASLPHILALAGVPDAWVRLSYSGDVHATGRINPLKLQLDLGGTISHFAVLDRSFRDPEAIEFLKLASTDLEGPATLTSRGVRLAGVEVRRGETVLSVDGDLAFDSDAGLDLRAAGETFDFSDIGKIASIPFEGIGQIAVTIEGPYSNLTVSGTAEIDQFSVFGYYVGDTKATVIYSDLDLTIGRASVRRDSGTITGAGKFRFGGEAPTVEGNLHLTNIEASDLLLTVGLDPALAQRFTSPVSGDVRVLGPLTLPAGRATLRAPKLRIDGVLVGKADIRLGFGEKRELIWGEFDLRPTTGGLNGRVALLPDRVLDIQIDARGISIDLLTPFIGDVPITGSLTGSAMLSGPADTLSGNVSADVSDLVAWGLRLEKAELVGKLHAGEMKITGTILSGDSDVSATMRVGRRLPFTATGKVEGLDVERVFPLGDATGVTISGTLFSQGDLTAPDTLMADMQLSSAVVRWNELELRSARDVRIQYAEGLFTVGDLLLAAPGTQAGISGTVTTSGELNLHVIGKTDLRSAGSPGRNLRWQRGTLDLDTRVGGTIKRPELFGEASIHDASVNVASGSQLVDKINAKVDFVGRSIHLKAGNALVGGGKVRFAGQLLLPAEDKPRIDVSVDLESITIRPYPDLHTQLSGNINIAGPIGDLLVQGQIDLDALRYSVNFDLKRLIPSRNAPLNVPAFEPGQVVALAVAIKAPNNLIISNNVIEAEFQADLLLTGTTERPGLIGSITPLWGRARYRDSVFKVERASIDFTEEFRIFTRFDIHTTTDACGMKISVDIHGNSDTYNVVPSAQDDTGTLVDSQDVFACLQFGMRMAEFQERVSQEDTGAIAADPLGRLTTSPLASGLDAIWAVSGMDEKIRRLLPIQLDEVRLESGWSSQFKRTTMRVVVGKDLGKDFKFKYASSLDEINDQSVSVQYRLSDKALLQGSWLSTSDVPIGDLGLDLRLRWEFR